MAIDLRRHPAPARSLALGGPQKGSGRARCPRYAGPGVGTPEGRTAGLRQGAVHPRHELRRLPRRGHAAGRHEPGLAGNKAYDAPAADHAWRIDASSDAAGLVLNFSHAPPFTDIGQDP